MSSLPRTLPRSFASFMMVGGLATGVQYAILILTVEWFGWKAPLASSIGFCISAVLNYWLNYHVTFNSKVRHPIAAARFLLVAIIGLGINAGTMMLLEQEAGLHYILAQLLATGLTLCWTFSASAFWTFRDHR